MAHLPHVKKGKGLHVLPLPALLEDYFQVREISAVETVREIHTVQILGNRVPFWVWVRD